ncbi:MAG: hypothetical protein E7184_02180 [Erysipelotrichaceae bacterium]|nr:hypothetical protein [Erysipelotrichaceae bacterium]
MFNFNPYITSGLMRSQIPFSLPGSSAVASAATKSFSWSGLFNGIQKTVGTVNQIIPLYQNVKPIISNSKTLLKVMRSLNTPNINNKIETVQTENANKTVITPKEEQPLEMKSQCSPAKPFFN